MSKDEVYQAAENVYAGDLSEKTKIEQAMNYWCIASTDASIKTSLSEYDSLFRLPNGNMKYIHSHYNYDNDKIIYQPILFNDKKDILEFINEDIDQNILNYLGIDKTKLELIKELIHHKRHNEDRFYHTALHLISGILDYYSIDIRYRSAENPAEIIKREVLI